MTPERLAEIMQRVRWLATLQLDHEERQRYAEEIIDALEELDHNIGYWQSEVESAERVNRMIGAALIEATGGAIVITGDATPPAPARSDPPRPAPRPRGDAGTASR